MVRIKMNVILIVTKQQRWQQFLDIKEPETEQTKVILKEIKKDMTSLLSVWECITSIIMKEAEAQENRWHSRGLKKHKKEQP